MKIDVKHIAKLANLVVEENQIPKFEKQLSEVLNYVKKLEEVDTKNIEPTSQVTGLENVAREDDTHPSLAQEEAISQAKNTHNEFFQVKGVFEEK